MPALFNPRKSQWWNAPLGEQRRAYYMTLRVHYEMPAAEALRLTNRNAEALCLDKGPGFIVNLRNAINPTKRAS